MYAYVWDGDANDGAGIAKDTGTSVVVDDVGNDTCGEAGWC